MKCNKCGVKIDKCGYGNPDCDITRHQLCKDCGLFVGLGCHDPCYRLEITPEMRKEAMQSCDCGEAFIGDGIAAICTKCGHQHVTDVSFFEPLEVQGGKPIDQSFIKILEDSGYDFELKNVEIIFDGRTFKIIGTNNITKMKGGMR